MSADEKMQRVQDRNLWKFQERRAELSAARAHCSRFAQLVVTTRTFTQCAWKFAPLEKDFAKERDPASMIVQSYFGKMKKCILLDFKKQEKFLNITF